MSWRTTQRAIIGLIAVVSAGGNAQAQSNSDAKLWAGFTGRIELIPRLALQVEQQDRMGADAGIQSSITQLGVQVRVHEYVALGAAYRLTVSDNDDVSHRVAADLRLRYRFRPWTVSYRLRGQSASRAADTRTTIRNRLKGSYALSKRLSPFASTELHYLTTNSEFREFRAQAGLDAKLRKRLALTVFYMFQSEFNKSVDEQNHILGVGLSYVFRRARGDSGKLDGSAPKADDSPADDAELD